MGKVFLFIDFLEKGRIINSEYYIALSVYLKEEITKKWSQMKKKVLFHQDNALCQKSIVTMAKLHKVFFELFLHPPYSSDLAPHQLLAVCRPQKNGPGKEI